MGFQPHGQSIVIVSLCCLVVCELVFINVTITVPHEQATEAEISLA